VSTHLQLNNNNNNNNNNNMAEARVKETVASKLYG
jgi:hypothetical protein